MTDIPRGPLDQEPNEPGWWAASDGKWYPPESSAPTEAVPTVSPREQTAVLPVTTAAAPRSVLDRVRAWPLWAKIAAPVVTVLLIAGIAGAGTGSPRKSAAAKPVVPSTTSIATTTTRPVTTTAPPTTTPRPTTTAKPKPVVAVTTVPATAPPPPPPTSPPTPPPTTPATQPAGPSNPGDSKNCSDFASYSEAKAWYDTYYPAYGDVGRLDSDGDGIPCESLAGAPG